MATSLSEWIDAEVKPVRDKPLSWLSHQYFFRDPPRPIFADSSCFFSPADGILLYQRTVTPDESIVDIKGRPYSLRDALRDPGFDRESFVVGIFMTFFDVHVNRIPFPARLSYRLLEPIDTYNHPMLDVEKSLLDELRVSTAGAGYLHHNQRVVNRLYAPLLNESYYILQVADYDVDCITPFELKQNQPCAQGKRFSTIRFGSQVDLIVPLSERYDLAPVQQTGVHVQAGLDPLLTIRPKPAQLG